MRPSLDVLVVGAGAAGTSTALLAARRGLRVGLVEARPSGGAHGWGTRWQQVMLRNGSERLLQTNGVVSPAANAGNAPLGLLERAIAGAARRHGATMAFEAPVDDLRDLGGPDGVVVRTRDGASYLASIVVDATGGRLSLPAGAGIARHDVPGNPAQRYVVGHYDVQPMHSEGFWGATWGELGAGSGPFAEGQFMALSHPTGGIHLDVMGPNARQVDVLTPEELAAAHTRFAARLGISSRLLDPIAVHDAAQSIAPTARAGNVLLAGDSIGRVHPGSGTGASQAILGAKLAVRTIDRALRSGPEEREAVLQRYGRRAPPLRAPYAARRAAKDARAAGRV